MKNTNLNPSTEKAFAASMTSDSDILEFVPVEHDIPHVMGDYNVDPIVNMSELAQNAIGGIKLAVAQDPCYVGMVKMWTEERANGVHFMIANNGVETDYATVLSIGKSSHLTSDHQRGTGFKTAVLGLNNSDAPGSWKLFLRRNGVWSKTEAPYPMNNIAVMLCSDEELSRIPEWATVCIDVLLQDANVFNNITVEKLGYQFAWTQTLRKVHLTYCGQVIDPTMPSGTVKYDIKNKVVEVMGIPHTVNCLVVDAKDASPDDVIFANGEHAQGLHLYANGFLMNHFGMRLFKKKNIKKNASFDEMFLKPVHPELNRLQISLNIDTPEDHSLEIPVNNFKNNAKWASEIGMAYVDAINNLVICYRNKENTFSAVQDDEFPIPVTLADYVRLSKRAFKEAGHRQTLEDTFRDIEEGNFHMFPECSCSASDIKGNERSRADLLLVKEVDAKGNPILSTTTTTIEYKAGAITPVRITNAIAYYELLAMNYGADPCIRLYGSGITTEAKRFAAHMVKKGYRIKCIHWRDRTPLWARDMWED